MEIEKDLKKLGFKVSIPLTAKKMEKSGNFGVAHYKTWFKDPQKYNQKTFLMRNHIDKVAASDAVLIANFRKKGLDGYIGGNTLIEAAIAFYLKKPIFVLNKVPEKNPNYEEIIGMKPQFIDGDLNRIESN